MIVQVTEVLGFPGRGITERLHTPDVLILMENTGIGTAHAVACYARAKVSFGTVYERINELAVADILLAHSSLLSCQIRYEPPITTNGRRIDFVVPMAAGSTLYIEVKTVRPTQGDTEQNWQNYERRRQHHTVNTNYVVERKYRGAEI